MRLTRSLKVARAAAEDFGRMLGEAKRRAEEARTDVYRRRYEALIAEGDALTPKIEAVAEELVQLLDQRAALYGDASQAQRYYNGDQANALVLGIRPAVQSFVDQTFHKWLH